MEKTNSTALKIPGWYIEFQAALLRQAPRPDEIDQVTAEGWTSNQKGLKKNLAGCLLPMPVETPTEPGKSEPVPRPHLPHYNSYGTGSPLGWYRYPE